MQVGRKMVQQSKGRQAWGANGIFCRCVRYRCSTTESIRHGGKKQKPA